MFHKEICSIEKQSRLKAKKPTHFRNQTEAIDTSESKENDEVRRQSNLVPSYHEGQHIFSGFESKNKSKFFDAYFKSIYKREGDSGNKIRKIIMRANNSSDAFEKRNGKKNELCSKPTIKSTLPSSRHKIQFSKGNKERRSFNYEGRNLNFEGNFCSKRSSCLNFDDSIESYLENWRIEVDKICISLKELKSVDSAEKKIHKWCKNYFDEKKKDLIDIFMKKINKKKSLNDEVIHLVIFEKEIILDRLNRAIVPMSEKERYFMGIEISLFKNFIEEKIAHKQKMELQQIENRVRSNINNTHMKLFAKDLYRSLNLNSEINTFFVDLQRLEENYGKLNLLSSKNRRRFENISQSELNMKAIINF